MNRSEPSRIILYRLPDGTVSYMSVGKYQEGFLSNFPGAEVLSPEEGEDIEIGLDKLVSLGLD